MPVSHPIHARPTDALPVAIAALRARGLRVSAARRMLLQALFAADGPATAAELAGGLDVASVYRNLETLEELGIVRHFHVGRGAALYAPATAAPSELLACERCGDVHAVALDDVRALVEARFGFLARFTRFPLVGLCATCARS